MLKIVRQWIIDTLGFSKSEANGTIILILLILATAVLPKIYMHNTFASSNGFIDEKEDLKKWARELEVAIKKAEQKEELVVEKERTFKSYTFDPNLTTMNQLLELGFTERTVGTLINFREKGGHFNIKSDLLKIYGISETRVKELWEFIDLPENDYAEEKSVLKSEKEETIGLELNSVIAEDLKKIRGIGSVLSARIISFRDGLGGFYSLHQLDEVYGLNAEVLESLKKVSLISGDVRKLNINTDSASHLYKHPYINYNIAYAIVNYRSQHGDFDSLSQIKRIKIVSDSLYQKIYPYLSLNQ